MRNWTVIALAITGLGLLLSRCTPDDPNQLYDPTPYIFDRPEIDGPNRFFPEMVVPPENPLTEAKVDLGRMLFYDPILSVDSGMNCAACHAPDASFTDPRRLSINAIGGQTRRNSMVLMNLGWNRGGFFWDGRAETLEEAVDDAVVNELHPSFPTTLDGLRASPMYQEAFARAFRDGAIDRENLNRAIASFLRIMVSVDSKYDEYKKFGLDVFTDAERRGFVDIFSTEVGDCFHCHGVEPFLTDNDFHNNGLQAGVSEVGQFSDIGRGEVTGDTLDYGLFRSPTLRNLAFSAPFMHDGRLETIDDVIDFYSEGLHFSPTVDPLMKAVHQGGVQLTPQEKADLKAFLLALTDTVFLTNPEYQDPF